MTDEQLFDVLRPLILTVTGVPECILANPNAPSPSGAYCSVRAHQGITQRGQANNYKRNIPNGPYIDVEKDARAQIIAKCAIEFFRGDAMNFAQKLLQMNRRPDVQAALFKANIGWQGTGPINNITALQSDNFESRAYIDVHLMYETSDPVVINQIASAQVIVEDEKSNELANITVDTV
jgi:hypothetical protein